MGIKALPRMAPPAVPADVGDLAKSLYNDIGYNVLLHEHTTTADEAKLFEACVACDIRPFQTKAVQKYKDRCANRDSEIAGTIFVSLLALGSAVVIGAAIYIGSWRVLLGLIGVAFLAFMTAVIVAEEVLPSYTWKGASLGNYSDPVPLPVLRMAQRLKAHRPDVSFRVDYLTRSQKTADPFLVAMLGSASLYIAVWDEPKFDAAYE